jgi:hypothetical protein
MSIRCSGCGSDIPFHGDVCPFCLKDKTGVKLTNVFGFFFGFIGMVIGYAVAGISWALVLGLVGMIIGFVVGSSLDPNKARATEPASADSGAIAYDDRPSGDEPDVEERLERLEYLKDKGLLSDSEYKMKKRDILDDL